jgi:hypothetical protein
MTPRQAPHIRAGGRPPAFAFLGVGNPKRHILSLIDMPDAAFAP